jgi:hypothetical protein
MSGAPITFVWDGQVMVPQRRFTKLCDQRYAIGEEYPLAIAHPRSKATQGHYFARLEELFDNLPEDVAELYPTIEHLRKRALIEAGYFDQEIIECGSEAVAVNVASAIRKRDDFAHIIVAGRIVAIRTAKSQRKCAMGAKAFQDSKDKVLAIVENMVGVKRSEVGNAA